MSDDSTPLPISQLRSCAEGTNPNVMSSDDLQMLKASISSVGFNQPILVAGPRTDESGEAYYIIVDGHHRTSAMMMLGFAEIPAIVRDWDDSTATAVRLAMNRLRGVIDMRIAQTQITALVESGWTPEQLTLTGFSQQELVLLSEESTPKLSAELGEMGATTVDESTPQAPSKEYKLELTFTSKSDYMLAKRELKKASGESKDLVTGLMAILGAMK